MQTQFTKILRGGKCKCESICECGHHKQSSQHKQVDRLNQNDLQNSEGNKKSAPGPHELPINRDERNSGDAGRAMFNTTVATANAKGGQFIAHVSSQKMLTGRLCFIQTPCFFRFLILPKTIHVSRV